MATGQRNLTERSPLGEALSSLRHAFVVVGALSGLLNLMMLSGSFFMLMIYDRVLPSRSIPSLVGLVILFGVIYAFQALLDLTRSRILVEVGSAFNASLGRKIYDLIGLMQLRTRDRGDGLQSLHDLDQLRSFISGPGPAALLDLPWMFLYLTVCFMFHWLIGLTALAGATAMIALTLLTETLTRKPALTATRLASQRLQLAMSGVQNAEALRAMGMQGRSGDAWTELSDKYMQGQKTAADVVSGLGAFTRAFRIFLQSGVLAVGAYLVIEQKATGGIIIASSILTARALAPVELAIANWRSFVASRQSWARLNALLAASPTPQPVTPLPAPHTSLSVEALSVAPPGATRLTVQDITFRLAAGAGLGVIGPSGCGKSSLVRGLLGVWEAQRGAVRLDGASLDQWDLDRLGGHIGYIPQSIELLTGSIAQNIARFDPGAMPDDIIAAAIAADIHDFILRLQNGYETSVGLNGAELSAGQRQRVALARALFRNPFLIVLDEPNSNLDADGEAALTKAIQSARDRGAIVIVVAHRQSALQALDQVMLMAEGRMQMIGPKGEVLAKIMATQGARPNPISASLANVAATR